MRTASKLVKTLLMQLSSGLDAGVTQRLLLGPPSQYRAVKQRSPEVCAPFPTGLGGASVFYADLLKTPTQLLLHVPALRSDTNSIPTYSDCPSKLIHDDFS